MQDFDSMLNVAAIPQDEKKAAFVSESRENRARCYEMSEQMTEEVATNAETFRQYLDTQSRFDRYTANNVLLIMAQRPDAQRLGDYGYWRDQGAFVRRSERRNPVLIMEPGKEYERDDGSIGQYYNAKKVYDITQTNLRVQEEPERQIEDRTLIRALVNNPPVAIETTAPEDMPVYDKGALFVPEDGKIYVRTGMNAEEIFQSLTPELLLAQIAKGDRDFNRDEYAFHAYCASYILCRKCGVETERYDFSHAPEQFEGLEAQEVRSELSVIRDAASEVSARMAKVLDLGRNQRSQEQTR